MRMMRKDEDVDEDGDEDEESKMYSHWKFSD